MPTVNAPLVMVGTLRFAHPTALSTSLRGAKRRSNPYLHAARWIASRSLSSGAHSRDPLARNDGATSDSIVKQQRGCASAFSRHEMPEVCVNFAPSEKTEGAGSDRPARIQASPPSLRANGSRECAPDDKLSEAIHATTQRQNGLPRRFAPRNDGLTAERLQEGALSRKYGSTGPCTFSVSGLP